MRKYDADLKVIASQSHFHLKPQIQHSTPSSELVFNRTFTFVAANFKHNVVEGLPKELDTGVYYGWANVDNGEVHKMVMSIGWNPFFANKTKSMVRKVKIEVNVTE
jgi:FAD synthase